MKRSTVTVIAILSCVTCYMLHVTRVHAQNMDSTRFRIQYPNINIGAGDESSDSYNLSTTIGQTAAGEFQSQGYFVRAGFEYIHTIIPFTFSVSDTSVDFGELRPQTPATAKTDLRVSFGGAGVYQVAASEQGPLKNLTGEPVIPDTSCDGAPQKCTPVKASKWIQKNVYGFGYSMSGEDVPNDFQTSSYFRPFANKSAGQTSVPVMSNANVTYEPDRTARNTHSSTVTFKVNIPSTQQTGTYQTIVDFVATPSY